MPQTRQWRAGQPASPGRPASPAHQPPRHPAAAVPPTRFLPPPVPGPAAQRAMPRPVPVAQPKQAARPVSAPPVHRPPVPRAPAAPVPVRPSHGVVQRSKVPSQGERPREVTDVTKKFDKYTLLSPIRQGIVETFTKRYDFTTALVKGDFAYALPWKLVRYPLYFLLIPKEQRRQDYRSAAENYVKVEGKKAVATLLTSSFWFLNPFTLYKVLKGTAEITYDVGRAVMTPEKDIEKMWEAHDRMVSSHVKKIIATMVTGLAVSKALTYSIPRTREMYRVVPKSARIFWMISGVGAFMMQLHELQSKYERLPGPFKSTLSECVDKRLKECNEEYGKRYAEYRASEPPFD